MRPILMSAVLSLAAVAAHAQSIDVIKTTRKSHSIDFIRCTSCAPLKPRKVAEQQVTLTPGTQKIEVKEIGGVKKVFRTEAWLGGSPVTYVSKAEADMLSPAADVNVAADDKAEPTSPDDGAKITPGIASTADMSGNATPVAIDKDTTSSTTADMSGESVAAAKPAAIQKFDPSSLQLRLN